MKHLLKNKLFKIILSVTMMLSLSGCIIGEGEITLNADGSGFSIFNIGFSKLIFDKVESNPEIGFGWDYTTENINGHDYYITRGLTDSFETITDANSNRSIIHMFVARDFGDVQFKPIVNGFKLSIEIVDIKEEDFMELPEFENISHETMEGMTAVDLVAGKADNLYLDLKVNMPYPVKQISGNTQGVVINGKTIELDYVTILENGPTELIFESITEKTENLFKDVPNSLWCSKAVNSLAISAIVNGYGDGNFYPEKTLNIEELSTIFSRLLEANTERQQDYDIDIHNLLGRIQKIVFMDKPIPTTGEVYLNTMVTREEAIFTIYTMQNRDYFMSPFTFPIVREIDPNSILDLDEINPKFRDGVINIYNTGVINGSTDGKFHPKDKITRGEVCQILYNAGLFGENLPYIKET